MNPPLVVLARIGSPNGIAGALNISLAGEHLHSFVGQTVQICTAPALTGILTNYAKKSELVLKQAEPAHGTATRVKFESIIDRTTAAHLTHSLITVPLAAMQDLAQKSRKSKEPAIEELWYFELIGMTVCDADSGKPIATVTDVEDLGLNTVITLTPTPGQSLLPAPVAIPLNYPHWQKVDLAKNQVTLAEWQIFIETQAS